MAEGTAFPQADRVQAPDVVRPGPGLGLRPRRATYAVAQALFRTDEGAPPAERLRWLVDELEDFLARAGRSSRWIYRACLGAISVLAPLFIARLPPFRALSEQDRIRALARFEASPLGIAVFGCKLLLCILYYEHPEAARAVGFDGRCMESETAIAEPGAPP